MVKDMFDRDFGCGHFIYYESSGHSAGDTGLISIKKHYRRWSSNCLQFYLSMYSAYPSEMGSLEVFLYDDTTKQTRSIFKQKGVLSSTASDWKEIKIEINLPKEDPYWILFKATRGRGYNSDIAIDDIMIKDGNCSKFYSDAIVDIAFYIHTSSNQNSAVPDEKCFIKSVAETFGITTDKTRAAVITAGASSSNRTSDNLSLFKSRIQQINTTTMMDRISVTSALAAITQSFTGRTGVPRVAVFLTDTERIDVETDVKGIVDARRDDIKFLAVGVGPSVNQALLDDFADGNGFIVNDFPDLCDAEFIRQVAKEASPAFNWLSWSDYTKCSVNCGRGKRYRERNCSLSFPNECNGESVMWEICNEKPCPIDGSWSDWGPWSQCDKSCRGGRKHRTRECSNPSPAHGGLHCEKLNGDQDIDETQYMNCGGDGECEYVGEWGGWNYTACSTSVGLGTQLRSRKCDSPPQSGPGGCRTNIDLGGILIPVLRMEENENVICGGINGSFGNWTEFNVCNVSCGGGVQSRNRTCDSPEPQYNGNNCTFSDGNTTGIMEIETQECNTHQCTVNGSFGNWTEFTVCNVTCGGGVQSRNRTCNSPEPQYNGTNCTFSDRNTTGMIEMETQECNTHPCPVNGAFGNWTEFTACSSSCEEGFQSRNRTCDSPEPQYNGTNCTFSDGNSTGIIEIETQKCSGVGAIRCGSNSTAKCGYLTSPNYPNDYPHNEECITVITAPEGHDIQISIVDMDIEVFSSCQFDYLEIIDGSTSSGSVIGKYCGRREKFELTSTTNAVRIKFKTDDTVKRRGFRLTWKTHVNMTIGCHFKSGVGDGVVHFLPNVRTRADCAQACIQRSDQLPGINGVVFATAGLCFCIENMTAISDSSDYVACLFEMPSS